MKIDLLPYLSNVSDMRRRAAVYRLGVRVFLLFLCGSIWFVLEWCSLTKLYLSLTGFVFMHAAIVHLGAAIRVLLLFI